VSANDYPPSKGSKPKRPSKKGQQPDRVWRIGYLSSTERPGEPQAEYRRRLMEDALARLGYSEGAAPPRRRGHGPTSLPEAVARGPISPYEAARLHELAEGWVLEKQPWFLGRAPRQLKIGA
jgi:hypothetical protein